MTKTAWAHVAMLVATILYGANYRLAKDLMPDPIAPFAFIMLRIVGAGLLFWVLHSFFVREKVPFRALGRLFLCGFFGAAFNMLLFFKGLSMTSPINASVIIAVVPIMVLFISYVMRLEGLTLVKMGGIVLGFSGTLLLLLAEGGDFSLAQVNFWGDLMVWLNGASYALYLVLARPLMQHYHPLTVVKWVFLFGGMCSLPVAWGELSQLALGALSAPQWGRLIFVVFGATAFTYLLNMSALRHVQASMVGYYVYLQPLVTTFLDVMLGYAWPGGFKVAAAALIFAGVYMVSQPERSKFAKK